MPKIKETKGYDPIISYSLDEIVHMYITEGVEKDEAYKRALTVRKEIGRLNKHEQRLWDKVRDNEDITNDTLWTNIINVRI